MKIKLDPRRILSVLSVFLFASSAACAEGPEEGKILSLDNVTVTCYALGGDTATLKEPVESLYVYKGDAGKALIYLKNVIIEGEREVTSFGIKDPLYIIVFRGFFPGLSKVTVKKVVLKGTEFDIYAEYWNAPEYSTASQPAAIIPVGQLPPGKYSVILFVGNELHKKTEFKVKGR